MKSSSLESKTVRPGLGLDNYTGFYKTSDSVNPPKKVSSKSTKSRSKMIKILAVVLVLVGGYIFITNRTAEPAKTTKVLTVKTDKSASSAANKSKPVPAVVAPAAVTPTTGACAGNKLDKLAIVSVSRQHMWACEGNKAVYDSPVITGIQRYPETLTPVGTYKIYSKQKDVTLTGVDSTGSWNDKVDYWMPFLSNEYGIYGFHNAPWRTEGEFGNTDPNSLDGSHGCVNLPKATAVWLYNWSPVGTTVTVEA